MSKKHGLRVGIESKIEYCSALVMCAVKLLKNMWKIKRKYRMDWRWSTISVAYIPPLKEVGFTLPSIKAGNFLCYPQFVGVCRPPMGGLHVILVIPNLVGVCRLFWNSPANKSSYPQSNGGIFQKTCKIQKLMLN